ncbi:unnamed protein product, partial [Discosporangium mesarthrocarpum]
STLDRVAQLRVTTEYLPHGPLFMMPPGALRALSLSTRHPREAITVGMKVDLEAGRVTASRVMLSVLPPVTAAMTFDEANRWVS